ncbi:MAG: hypothetical protein NTV72_03780 [Candidatus Taylorbacteria bacterium]|nr:hypothetical protein [Candidatus Taylorbacteria bacterium]
MKKTLLIAIIFLGLIVGVSGAKALTSDEVEMLITVLNLDSTRAATLRGMATTPAVRTNCYVFNRNVKINDSNPDVLELTKSLKILGYLESTSGTFDENVAAAVFINGTVHRFIRLTGDGK